MKQPSKPKLGHKIGGRLYLTDEEKLTIVKDYLSGDACKNEVYKRYTGYDLEHGKITKWLRRFNLKDKGITNFELMPKKDQESSELETEMLKKRIQELERKLETAEMKALAYSTMVDIAERELNIPIRKKVNTKPLKK